MATTNHCSSTTHEPYAEPTLKRPSSTNASSSSPVKKMFQEQKPSVSVASQIPTESASHASLDRLSTELLQCILNHASVPSALATRGLILTDDTQIHSPGQPRLTLKYVSSVNRRLHALTRPMLFHEVTIHVSSPEERRTRGFTQFLWANPEIRRTITVVNVPLAPNWPLSKKSQELLERVMVTMDRLQKVRFGGEATRIFDRFSLRGLQPSVLHTIEAHPNSPQVEIDCYVHTLDCPIALHNVHNISSLRVCLVDDTAKSNYEPINWTLRSPSTEVCDILDSNVDALKDFAISLPKNPNGYTVHSCFMAERADALRRIGAHVPRELNSLTLEGCLSFNDDAWSCWEKRGFAWNTLTSLSLSVPLSLIRNMAQRLTGRMTSLKTLKVGMYHEVAQTLMPMLLGDFASFGTFVQSLDCLEDISLQGFHPDHLIDLAKGRGEKLRRMRFHVRKTTAFGGLDLGLAPEFMLSQTHINMLALTCPRLSQLGLDVYDLGCDTSAGARYPRNNRTLRSEGLYSSLSTLPSLEHLRLFLHGSFFGHTGLSIKDAIALFRRLRHKQDNAALKSLVICHAEGGSGGFISVWDIGGSCPRSKSSKACTLPGEDEVLLVQQKCDQNVTRQVWRFVAECDAHSDKISQQPQYNKGVLVETSKTIEQIPDWQADPIFAYPEGF